MNNLEEQLKALKSTHLRDDEREDLRMRVMSVMESTPVISAAVDRHHVGREKHILLNSKKKNTMIGLIIAGIFALSGGVSFAAQGSLPGDMLYPVKIHLNENIESAVAISAKADAEVARRQLERRAEEAAQLHAEHRLSAEVKAELAADTQVHAEAYKKAEAELTHEGESVAAVEVKTEMQATIDTHQEVLQNLGVYIDLGAVSSVNVEQEGGAAADTTNAGVESNTQATGTLDANTATQGDVKIEFPRLLPFQTEARGDGSLKVGL